VAPGRTDTDGQRVLVTGGAGFVGSNLANFVYASDAVRALIRAAEERLTGAYNVGTGRHCSFNRVVDLINDALGTDVEPEYEPIRLKNYDHYQRADASKLRAATGWEPAVDFQDGVRRVCEPYR